MGNDDFDIDFFDDEDESDIITMLDENNEPVSFLIIDGVIDNGVQYLLVVEAGCTDDEPEALILKESSSANDYESIYTFIEDDDEYNKILILLQDNDNDYELKV